MEQYDIIEKNLICKKQRMLYDEYLSDLLSVKYNDPSRQPLLNTSNVHVNKLSQLKNILPQLVRVVDSLIEQNLPKLEVKKQSYEDTIVQSIHSLEHSVNHLCKVVQLLLHLNPSNTIKYMG